MPLDPRTPGSKSKPLDRAAGEVELIVSGDLDLATRDELLVRLLTLGLRRSRALAADLGVEVTLRSPQDQARVVLELTGLSELLTAE